MIENGPIQWRSIGQTPQKYLAGCIEEEKMLLVDLKSASGKDINKLLLEDLLNIAEKKKMECLLVGISQNDQNFHKILRNLLVFGFEKTGENEAKKLTSKTDVVILKMEVNQECDFVDLS